MRSYSLSSCPIMEEPLETTIKRVSGGVFSNYMIDHIHEGDTVLAQKPLGEFFTLAKDLKPKTYVLFAAGIGITPLFSILKSALISSDMDKVILVYSNRFEQDMIYKEDLESYLKKYKNLKIEHIFSKKEGRLNSERILKILSEVSKDESRFYLCGPPDYMKMIKKTLIVNKVNEFLIYTEDFKVVPQFYPKPDEDSIIFNVEDCEEEDPQTLEATFFGEKIKIPMNRKISVLEQLLEEGYNVPFSCASGSCMSCMAKLKKGKVFQIEHAILDETNIDNNELLTCQTYPLSKHIVLDYDDI